MRVLDLPSTQINCLDASQPGMIEKEDFCVYSGHQQQAGGYALMHLTALLARLVPGRLRNNISVLHKAQSKPALLTTKSCVCVVVPAA